MAGRGKGRKKVDIACDKEWLSHYAPSHPGKNTMEEGNQTYKGAPFLTRENGYTSFWEKCGQCLLGLLMLRTI